MPAPARSNTALAVDAAKATEKDKKPASSNTAVAVDAAEATEKDKQPSPAVVAVKFGAGVLQPRRQPDPLSDSSSEVSLSDSSSDVKSVSPRRKQLVKEAERMEVDKDRSGKATSSSHIQHHRSQPHPAARQQRSQPRQRCPRSSTAVAVTAVSDNTRRRTIAVEHTQRRSQSRQQSRRSSTAIPRTQRRSQSLQPSRRSSTAVADRHRQTTAVAVTTVSDTQRRSQSRQPSRRSSTAVAATKQRTTAVADLKRRKSSSRSPSRKQERSRQTKAVAASSKRRQSISRSPPAPHVVERKKQRVVYLPYGYSSSGDERACRSGGMRVKGSLSKQYTKGDGGHAKGDCRDTREYKNQRARSIDPRGVSSVDARSRCKKERGLSSSESPMTRVLTEAGQEKPPWRPQLRARERKPQVELAPACALRARSPQVSRTHEEAAASSHLVPWRPPVDDAEANSSQVRIHNLVFGTSYVADLADLQQFRNWLAATPQHCHVILCQTERSAVADWLRLCSRGRCDDQGLPFKSVAFVTNRIYLVLKANFCTLKSLPVVFANLDDKAFAVAQIQLHSNTAPWHGGTAVAVAIVHILPHLPTVMPEWLMRKMHEAVRVHHVRCITGTFGLTSAQMCTFAQTFSMATPHAVCQQWRGTGSAKAQDVFPSYTLLLGTSRKFQEASRDDLPESAVAVSNNWVSTLYPFDQVVPWWITCDPDEANDVDWGYVKVKKVDPKRWIPHVHQVLFWSGTAKQGRAAHDRARTKSTEARSLSHQ